MQSFYGGRKGDSLIIVKSFATIDEMNAFFSDKAVNLDEVGYGEHVIIDTVNKSNADNGKLYRRGFEKAEYVAQIVGPQGPAPKTEIVSYDALVDFDGNGSLSTADGLLSGLQQDTIDYRWVNVVDENGNHSGIKIGFKMPYTAFGVGVQQSKNWWEKPSVAEVGSQGKPFYYFWQFSIPAGVPGDKIDKESFNIQDIDGKSYLTYNIHKYYLDISDREEKYEIVPIQIPYNEVDGIILDEDGTIHFNYTYKDDEVQEKWLKWIAKENGFILHDNGTLTVNYNTGDSQSYPNFLTWIESVTLGDDGTFRIIYNNNGLKDAEGNHYQEYEKTLIWVNNIEVESDGTITIHFNTKDKRVYDKLIKYIADVQLKSGFDEDQRIHVTYNTGEQNVIGDPINYILETAVTKPEEDNPYHLYVLYADPQKRSTTLTYNGKTGWVDLGYIRGEVGGLRLIGELDSEESLKHDGKWLNPKEVAGWTDERAGWGYVIGEDIWIYDYVNTLWFSIGKIAATPNNFVFMSSSEEEAAQLYDNGVWLVTETSKSMG